MSKTTIGPRYPSAFGGWTNSSRVAADDASYASNVLPEAIIMPPDTLYGASDHVSGFSFTSDSIPANAVITELTVAGEWYGSATGMDFSLQPRTASYPGSNRGGAAADSNKTSVAAISATSTTNLPSVAELVASTFGITMSASITNNSNETVYVDYVRLGAKYYVPATATTAAISAITGISATGGGNATDDGSGTVSAKGLCWGNSNPPTIADPKTTDGSGTGAFTSSLTGLFPSSRYYVRAYATTEDGTAYGPVVEFSTLASASRSLVARPFTTRAAAAELVARQGDALIDWWLEDDVARAELRPTDAATIPRDRWYVVSRGTPGATVSLTMDAEDTPDIICVVYRTYGVTGVRDGSIRRVYHPAAPTSPTQRVELVDITGQYMGTSEAATYAANVWTRTCVEAMTATVTAKGGLYTVDGQFAPAPLIVAGDWIDVVDLPGHGPVFITGTTYSKADHTVTITTGNREQTDLVIPGLSALPQALTVYGADTSSSGDSDAGGGPSSGGAATGPEYAHYYGGEMVGGLPIMFTSQADWNAYTADHPAAADDPAYSHWTDESWGPPE